MNKKFLGLTVCFIFVLSFFLFSQELEKQKSKPPMKKGQYVKVEGVKLIPSLYVNCCDDPTKNNCIKVLVDKGFIPVDDISVYVYNSGDKASSATTGKVEFFDLLTNSSKTFTFNVSPVNPDTFAIITNRLIKGPFLVKGGIKVSVTFKNIRGIDQKETATYNECTIIP